MVADDLNLDANAWRRMALVRRIPKREERLTAAASAVLEALHVLLGVNWEFDQQVPKYALLDLPQHFPGRGRYGPQRLCVKYGTFVCI